MKGDRMPTLPKIPVRCPKCTRVQMRKEVPVGMRLACSYCATIFVFYAAAPVAK